MCSTLIELALTFDEIREELGQDREGMTPQEAFLQDSLDAVMKGTDLSHDKLIKLIELVKLLKE